MEKKVWNTPELLQLDVKNTEFGGNNAANIDGPYKEFEEQKYWPSGS